jgi:ribosomal protein L15
MNIEDMEIIAQIEAQENIAYGVNDSALSNDRAEAIDYYLGQPFGNEEEGRSQVVSYDVQDTIESALPQLLKVFVAGDKVVQFDPKGPEDQEAAEQETDYINHVVMEQNEGFKIFYVWFKDALLSKNGYVKVYAEEEEEEEEYEYKGLTDAQLQMLASDEGTEVLEHTGYPDPSVNMDVVYQQAMMNGVDPTTVMQPMLHDVKLKVTEKETEIHIENVAPENMMISVEVNGPNLQDAKFVQHREVMQLADIAETFDKPLEYIKSIMSDLRDTFEEESNARDIYDEEYDRAIESQEALVKDTYIKLDGERYRVVVLGNTVLYKEKCEYVPFACITPMIMPHRHIGRSYADLTMDIQLIKSTLIRGQLDNMYLANNGRYAISDRVNLDDMLTSRPGGIVRVEGDPGSGIMPLSHPPLPASSFGMVEYMDSMKEKRTGITAYNQGLDANSLNKTATGVAQIMNASQQRIELVARTFAETGVKELFKLVHYLVRTTLTKPDIIRLRNKWVEVDPREWKARKDLSISVGLGAGNKDQQLTHLMSILNMQKEAIQIGLTSPEKIYNALAKLTQNAGFKNPEEFWVNPANNPQGQEPPKEDPNDKLIQGQLAIEQQKAQSDMALSQQKAQAQLAQEQERSKNDIIIEREKIMAQAELEKFKAQLKAETDLAIAQIKAQGGMMYGG